MLDSPVINPTVRILVNKVDLKSYSFSKTVDPLLTKHSSLPESRD